MAEAIVRLIAGFPGLASKLAHVIARQPGQSPELHFQTLMEALTAQARFQDGLGAAIAATLKPFRGGPR